MVKIATLQGQLATYQTSMIAGNQQQTEALNANLLSVTETARQAIGKLSTDNAYTLGGEVVRTVGTLISTKIASDKELARGSVAGQPERKALPAQKDEGKAASKPKDPPPPPAAASAPSSGATSREPIETEWISFFGVSEPKTPEPSTEPSPAAGDAQPADPATLEPKASTAADKSAGALAAVTEPEPADPGVALALRPDVAELEQFLVMLGIVPESIERPEKWSYRWAWDAIVRRVANLSDSSIAYLITSAQSGLGFLRELAALGTPPPGFGAGAIEAEVLP